MRKRGVLLVFVLVLCSSTVLAGINNVANCEDLKTSIENNNETNITSNLNCAGVDFGDWRSGNVATFTENFYGNNFTIFNLTLTGTTSSYSSQYVGLIPIAKNSIVRDIILQNLTIKAGTSPGGLIGQALNVNITNVYINASINHTGSSQDYAGGIVAYAENSTFFNVTFNGTLVTKDDKNGGIIGATSPNGFGTIINNSRVFGKIQGEINVGGFVGYSENLKLVDSQGNISVVGIVRDIGGAIGKAYSKTNIIGINLTVSISSYDIDVDNIGGLVGSNQDSSYFFVNNSHVKGNVIGSDDYIGGFIGYAYDNTSVYDSSFIGNVEGDQYVGGFTGYSYGQSNKYNYFIRSFSKGKVKGSNSYIGGFAGRVTYYTEINDSFSHSTVESTLTSGSLYLGGFGGEYGTSSNLYRNYFAGRIINKSNAYVGAFLGDTGSGNLGDNFYDNDTSLIQGPMGGSSKPSNNANVLGKLTWQLKQNGTFTNWDLTNIWRTESSYPIHYFFWEDLDGDGVEDIKDSLIGNQSNINAIGFNATLLISGSETLNNTYTGLQTVNITDGDNNTVSFNHNFSTHQLELLKTGEEIKIEKLLNGMVVNELTLQRYLNKTTKTAIINNTAIWSDLITKIKSDNQKE